MSTKQLDMWLDSIVTIVNHNESTKPLIQKEASITLWCKYLFNWKKRLYHFEHEFFPVSESPKFLPTIFDSWNHDPQLQKHLASKFMALEQRYDDNISIALCHFYLDLDTGNKQRINDWLRLSYRG